MSDNLPSTIDSLVNGLSTHVSRAGAAIGELSYMKMNKGGIWVYGMDNIEVEPESEWAVNPHSLASGYVAWADTGGEKLGEEMRPITAEPVLPTELPDVGASWAPQCAMQLACITGEDTGNQAVFATSSKGGNRAFNSFVQELLAHLSANTGTEEIVPVVELLNDSYQHKKYGTIYTPVIKIKRWVKMDDGLYTAKDDDGGSDDTPASDPAPEPPRRRRRRAPAAA